MDSRSLSLSHSMGTPHTVEQGSFNYTKAAEESNAENDLVNWNNPKLAELYLKDWRGTGTIASRWRLGIEWRRLWRLMLRVVGRLPYLRT